MSSLFSKKYKVIEKIGEGSFSEVLKCQNKVTGLYYAGKRLKKVYPSFQEIFDSPEVIAMRKINSHPNILCMMEIHFDPLPGKVTLIFELMDMSLYDLIKSRKGRVLTEQKVKLYLYQILKGLDHLHNHGIFHRDIKPENILIKGEIVKLADLGSIRGIYSKPPYTEYISTRWYRSPECLLTTGFYGPKMDVWAVGCVYYELLTLKPLFPGSNEIDQIYKIHEVIGIPHARTVNKFHRHKSKNCQYFFPNKPGTGLTSLLPHVTDGGKKLMKSMLIYDPDIRSNVKKLLENRYFNDLREQHEFPRHTLSVLYPSGSPQISQWKNPMFLSYIISEKRKKSKPLSTRREKFPEEMVTKLPRMVSSSPNARPILSTKSNITKVSNSERSNSGLIVAGNKRLRNNTLWRRNIYSTRTERMTNSSKSISNYQTKLPSIKHNGHYELGKTGIFQEKLSNEFEGLTYLPGIMKKPSACSVTTRHHNIKSKEQQKKDSKLEQLKSPTIKSPAKKIAKHETPVEGFDNNQKITIKNIFKR